jgi:hypothetical protein
MNYQRGQLVEHRNGATGEWCIARVVNAEPHWTRTVGIRLMCPVHCTFWFWALECNVRQAGIRLWAIAPTAPIAPAS